MLRSQNFGEKLQVNFSILWTHTVTLLHTVRKWTSFHQVGLARDRHICLIRDLYFVQDNSRSLICTADTITHTIYRHKQVWKPHCREEQTWKQSGSCLHDRAVYFMQLCVTVEDDGSLEGGGVTAVTSLQHPLTRVWKAAYFIRSSSRSR